MKKEEVLGKVTKIKLVVGGWRRPRSGEVPFFIVLARDERTRLSDDGEEGRRRAKGCRWVSRTNSTLTLLWCSVGHTMFCPPQAAAKYSP